MNENIESRREKITYEIKKAIKNINRNLDEWRQEKGNKINFTMSYTEVYSVTRNWIVRCLRSIIDAATVDRIFRRGHILISMDNNNFCVSNISLISHETYRSFYKDAVLIGEILESIDFTKLMYDPTDYEIDGLTQKQDSLELISFSSLENIKF